jgi:hypothetical protein
MSRTRAVLGIAAAALLAAAAFLGRGPSVRALYDSAVPPPVYRWVNTPADVVADHQAPARADGTVGETQAGSKPSTVGTGDGQAAAVFPASAFPGGEGEVHVTISPLDPATLPPPPGGLRFDGNAYRFEASGGPAGSAALAHPATVILRYPINATHLLRLESGRWRAMKATLVRPSLTVYGETASLGTFVPAGPPAPPGRRPPWMPLGAGAAAGAVALAHLARLQMRREIYGSGYR